jgi:hypothetical protein
LYTSLGASAQAAKCGARKEGVVMRLRPPIPSPPYRGGCLCGAVTWRLEERPLAINACHCDACKKLSGTTHLLMLLAKRAAFHSDGATHAWRRRADSGREVDIHRCAHCGTRLWHEPLSSPALVFIAAGTLDDSSWAVPASHIWIEKAVPGTYFHADAAQIEGQPKDRQTLMDAFAKLYPE